MKLNNTSLFIEQCIIGDKLHNANDKRTMEVTNPATQEVIGHVPFMTTDETKKAILRADKTLSTWKKQSADEKYTVMRQWYDLVLKYQNDLATIITTEQGKPFTDAVNEIRYAASFILWFAEEAKRINSSAVTTNVVNTKAIVTKEPIGVCGIITPWNFPAAMITRKVSPAIAAGCTTVIKPSPETPFTALALTQLALEAGIEPGTINVVTGDEKKIGSELTTSPIIKKISFTGSTETGKLLMAQSASTIKNVSMELGGNAPFIVCDDASFEKSLQGVINSRFRNTGQTCTSANRIMVHNSLYDEFCNRLVREVKQLKTGNGFEEGINQGPLINESAVKRVESLIEDAIAKGAELLLGGKRHSCGNCFFESTVIKNANTNMKFHNTEIFGPVAVLFSFNTYEEAISIANDTNYGLAAYIYSENLSQAWNLAEKLEYAMVGVNDTKISSVTTPFGGIKESGIGREGSSCGIEEYLEQKYLLINN